MNSIVEVCGLGKRFVPQRTMRDFFNGTPRGEVTAVDDVSFALDAGEIFGLLGPNGAGKTTLINMLCTLLIPSSGTARIGGIDVLRDPARIRKFVGLVTSNERSFYWRLTVRQNLQFFAKLYRVSGRGFDAWLSELLEALDIDAYADRRFDNCSTGIRQRVAFARALLHRPRIIFMDEPTKGLDPLAAVDLIRLIGDRILQTWGPTIIITSHNLVEIEKLCKRVAIMRRGKLLKCGSIEDLRESAATTKTYLLSVGQSPGGCEAAISSVRGVVSVRGTPENGRMRFEVTIDGHAGVLSDVLRAVLSHGGDIQHCGEVTVSLQDIFSRIVSSSGGG